MALPCGMGTAWHLDSTENVLTVNVPRAQNHKASHNSIWKLGSHFYCILLVTEDPPGFTMVRVLGSMVP
uniref:Uncharacterized protein n=3 Tax=Cercopithecinae TaxID=9528 RepID=A0A8I5QZ53_PAPAN